MAEKKIKLGRGQKLCPKCNNINAVRQRICKFCGHLFQPKNTLHVNEVTDWQSLEKGALVRVVQSTGPYYISNKGCQEDESRPGDRISMGYNGVFKVIRIDPKGIYAYGGTSNSKGCAYIYMGEPYHDEDTNIYYAPHRLIKEKHEFWMKSRAKKKK